ncbi:S-adenosylmethionine:tRNA ribosyltransferase-isomerase [Microbacter margulisiae]|uniref:S-adenosylmethionine:tRNA ribosyltransferase-isomerase n=1 Tax=Microbacter margulisiae TaxID=1350067 RepID=A0A7W5DSR8_9PORP|nr:S-adenosylmethionine:tRNA ribosyltransferase-isomerase [Microbacter margulisiae]MBB3188397.1 S-adenosylmethionine:tRNA ribosyltransferase-isomerase [Microbacter margulisiae]
MRFIKNHPQQLSIDAYDYELPDERIAKFPLQQRDASKLLLYREGGVSHTVFSSLADYLPSQTLLVRNNTRVVQARLIFHKATGARIELFCLEPFSPSDYALMFQQTGSCQWIGLIGNAKKWKEGVLSRPFEIEGNLYTLKATRVASHGKAYVLQFEWDAPVSFANLLEKVGELPIPPYLHREAQASDKVTYQTVYAQIEGSVAAPTAGLHFTESVLSDLKKKTIEWVDVTLHVGAGTFQPVKADAMKDHEMHTESIAVTRDVIRRLLEHKTPLVAVGTTSVRTLESLYFLGKKLLVNPYLSDFHIDQWTPYENDDFNPSKQEALSALIDYLDRLHVAELHASTQILIAPGYTFHLVDALITNFHQPRSTLLLLISAFVGDDWQRIYEYALQNDFRFLSYGDSSLLFPKKASV